MFKITKDFIKNHKFESDGLNFPDDEEIYFRPRKGMKLPPNAAENFTTLKIKLLELFEKHYEKNFAKLDANCAIHEDIMRKYLKGTRKITREAVAKFCVGTKLTVEESAELFTLQGHSLETETQLFDAIVVDALQCGDDMNIFFDTCQEYKLDIF